MPPAPSAAEEQRRALAVADITDVLIRDFPEVAGRPGALRAMLNRAEADFWKRELGLPFRNTTWVEGLPKSAAARFVYAVAKRIAPEDQLPKLARILDKHRDRRTRE